jgi:hypothetical protein
VYCDATIAAERYGYRQRDQLAGFRIDLAGLIRGFTHGAVAADHIRRRLGGFANGSLQLAAVFIPIEHHEVFLSPKFI